MKPHISAIPKRELVNLVIQALSEDVIRAQLDIKPDTDLRQRLDDFTKPQLIVLLGSTADGKRILTEAAENFPLHAPPTLYLVSIQGKPTVEEILRCTEKLYEEDRTAFRTYSADKPVRIVYPLVPASVRAARDRIVEIPLVYERKVEFTESNRREEDFGERKTVYSLERAFIWLPERHKHGVIACSDFVAVRPILAFGQEQLNLRWAVPNLTEDMLDRLAAKSSPRSATFTKVDWESEDALDVQTVTVSDPSLADRKGYKAFKGGDQREQTAGFFGNHPALARGGIGVARRYGRIWTPVRLGHRDLIIFASGIITSTETLLSREYDRDSEGYVSYFRNVPVAIDDRTIDGEAREAFDGLIHAILEAGKKKVQKEYSLTIESVDLIVKHSDKLRLIVGADFDCPNCSTKVLARCPQCLLPLEPRFRKGGLAFACPTHPRRLLADGQPFECTCGGPIDALDLRNHLRIFPQPECLAAVKQFMEDIGKPSSGGFLVTGSILRLISAARLPATGQLELANLQLWQVRAHYHTRTLPSGAQRSRIISVLNQIKEKCRRNRGHPSRETCNACCAEKITLERIETNDICLPRLLGLAIEKAFDGVHHGHEVADVRYDDTIMPDNSPVKVGIHLKSRTTPRRKGLGRSVLPIKALYTQLIYSAYLASSGKATLEALGISIPNTIHADVLRSLTSVANDLGYSFVALGEEEWIKIIDTVFEKLEVYA